MHIKENMRKLLLALTSFLFVCCSSDTDDVGEERFCWKFRVKVMTTIEEGSMLKSSSEISNQVHCDMTKEEAKSFADRMESETSSKQNGITVTISTKVMSIAKVEN